MNNIELKEKVVSILNNWLEEYWGEFYLDFEVESGKEMVDLYGFGYTTQDNKIIYMCNGKDEVMKLHTNASQLQKRINHTHNKPMRIVKLLGSLLLN